MYQEALDGLKAKFPFRKWECWSGEFCGASLSQDQETYEIQVAQQKFAEGMQQIKIARGVEGHDELRPGQVVELLQKLGEGNWLQSQTRMDLAVQVNLAQQDMGHPTVGTQRKTNNMIRRAKQHSTMGLRYLSIPVARVRLMGHSDAAFANACDSGTQGGYVLAAVDSDMLSDKDAAWSPLVWRSYRLKRVVPSTLSGEAQVLGDALGHLEWISCLWMETLRPDFDPRRREGQLLSLPSLAEVDCKSVRHEAW